MPHRVKNKHRARHRSHTFKAASLSKPALPLPADHMPKAESVEAPPQTDEQAADKEPVA